jgi:hypothetical protein
MVQVSPSVQLFTLPKCSIGVASLVTLGFDSVPQAVESSAIAAIVLGTVKRDRFRKAFIADTKKRGTLVRRIENSANSGMFDLVLKRPESALVCFVELKVARNEKEAAAPVDLLRPSQKAFVLEFNGAELYVAVEFNSMCKLYAAYGINGKVTLEPIAEQTL